MKTACLDQPCPYNGYSDTKRCWYHSQGLALPPNLRLPRDGFYEREFQAIERCLPDTFAFAKSLETDRIPLPDSVLRKWKIEKQ